MVPDFETPKEDPYLQGQIIKKEKEHG